MNKSNLITMKVPNTSTAVSELRKLKSAYQSGLDKVNSALNILEGNGKYEIAKDGDVKLPRIQRIVFNKIQENFPEPVKRKNLCSSLYGSLTDQQVFNALMNLKRRKLIFSPHFGYIQIKTKSN